MNNGICRFILVMVMMALAALPGCSRSSQVEDQAYVLVMGIDRAEAENIKITVQLPKISGGGSEGSSSGQGTGNGYTQMSISGSNFETVLEKLDWAVPRDLNLSHMKLIVISREIAESQECRRLIRNIAQTERLYTATRVAVCEGSAEDFVKAMQPVIGTRISTDIDAMFDHYISSGFVPESRLADLFYQTESVYSDPMITLAVIDKKAADKKEDKGVKAASALSGPIEDLSSELESEIAPRYLGAAVFRDGKLCGVFSGTQTIIANLLRNNVDAFRYKCDEQSLEIVPTRHVFVSVDAKRKEPEIRIDAKLSISSQERIPDEDALKGQLEKDIRDTIIAAQIMGAEPFGFAEKAAFGFRTLEEWTAYKWNERFKNAKIIIELDFARSDT